MIELVRFKEPIKNRECILAIFNIDEITIPPVQRDLSETLKRQLEFSIDKLGFLVPIIVTRRENNGCPSYVVIDGQHRLEAMKSLGAKEVIAIVVDDSLYRNILDFNTERPPNIRDKAKQSYRLFMEIFSEDNSIIESSLYHLLKNPAYLTLGFVLEEFDPKFPAGFYDDFLSKFDTFLDLPLIEASKERRNRAKALLKLNKTITDRYAELGLNNPLLKGEILRQSIQTAYGKTRIRTLIDEDFYTVIEKVIEACNNLQFYEDAYNSTKVDYMREVMLQ